MTTDEVSTAEGFKVSEGVEYFMAHLKEVTKKELIMEEFEDE